jgi:heat shock protein HslJ
MKKQTIGIIITVFVVLLAGVFLLIKINNDQKATTEKRIVNSQLIDKEWRWVLTAMSDNTKILPIQRDIFMIKFNEKGEFNGITDCNSFFGEYEVGESSIIFSKIASTKMYCEESQEQDFIATLNEAEEFKFDESGNLVLLLKLNSGLMIFN